MFKPSQQNLTQFGGDLFPDVIQAPIRTRIGVEGFENLQQLADQVTRMYTTQLQKGTDPSTTRDAFTTGIKRQAPPQGGASTSLTADFQQLADQVLNYYSTNIQRFIDGQRQQRAIGGINQQRVKLQLPGLDLIYGCNQGAESLDMTLKPARNLTQAQISEIIVQAKGRPQLIAFVGGPGPAGSVAVSKLRTPVPVSGNPLQQVYAFTPFAACDINQGPDYRGYLEIADITIPSSGGVVDYDPSGVILGSFPAQPTNPHPGLPVAQDSQGVVYAAQSAITKYAPNGSQIWQVNTQPGFPSSNGLVRVFTDVVSGSIVMTAVLQGNGAGIEAAYIWKVGMDGSIISTQTISVPPGPGGLASPATSVSESSFAAITDDRTLIIVSWSGITPDPGVPNYGSVTNSILAYNLDGTTKWSLISGSPTYEFLAGTRTLVAASIKNFIFYNDPPFINLGPLNQDETPGAPVTYDTGVKIVDTTGSPVDNFSWGTVSWDGSTTLPPPHDTSPAYSVNGFLGNIASSDYLPY